GQALRQWTKPPRGKAGRPEAYDWRALAEPLRQLVEEMDRKGERFESKADLQKWCIENVKLRPKARPPKGSKGFPDPETAKAAIPRHGLDKSLACLWNSRVTSSRSLF